MNSNNDEWRKKNKTYLHFDSFECMKRIDRIIRDVEETGILSHRFYPLIRITQKKVKRDENKRMSLKGERHIHHTARIDSNIYSYYRSILSSNYERILINEGISDCVIGYRKIPANEKRNKCNIHFAKDAIDEIKRRMNENEDCVAIALDIKGFFDNLDHKLIKRQWISVMGFPKGMPEDHYSVYKNITKYTYITRDKIEKLLNIKFETLYKKRKRQICLPIDFREKIVPHLSTQNKIGIPQGTPISDIIANIYMLCFDKSIQLIAKTHDGFYRRYSDDILLICPKEKKDMFKDMFLEEIDMQILKMNLCIKKEKTLITHFYKTGEEYSFSTFNHEDKRTGKPFEYLGLSYDCKKIWIRNPTLSGFYKKLTNRIKKEVSIAISKLKKKKKLVTAESVYKILSFDMIYNSYTKEKTDDKSKERDKNLISEKKCEDHHPKKRKGNFAKYVHRVAEICENPKIKELTKGLNNKIKKRARNYCHKITKKWHLAKRYK